MTGTHTPEDLPPLSSSVPPTAVPPVWNIPYPRNPFFVGRDELLSLIHTQLQARQTTALSQPQAISSLGGIGKTQLAVEYVYRYHHDYVAVLWACAESQEALTTSFNKIADLLALPEREAREQEIISQAVLGRYRGIGWCRLCSETIWMPRPNACGQNEQSAQWIRPFLPSSTSTGPSGNTS